MDAYITINDCFVDFFEKQPNKAQLGYILKSLPLDIKNLATEWGWNDTVVGDKVWVWIRENKNSIPVQCNDCL